MLKSSFFFLILFIGFYSVFSNSICAQPTAVPILWQHTYGGNGQDDSPYITSTFDGGYVILSTTDTHDNGDVFGLHYNTSVHTDLWLIKVNAGGQLLWQKCYGSSGDETGCSICQTPDSGFVLLSNTFLSTDGDVTGWISDYNPWIVKVNSKGDIVWQKCLEGQISDRVSTLITTKEGGFAVVASILEKQVHEISSHGRSDVWFVKLDSIGNIEWQKTYGGSDDDYGRQLVQMPDGGYGFSGLTRSRDGDVIGFRPDPKIKLNIWIVKVDPSGSIEWQKTLGGSSNKDIPYSLIATKEGEIVVAGNSQSIDGDFSEAQKSYNAWVLKLSAKGTTEWQKFYGGTATDGIYSIIQTSDGEFAFVGGTYSYDENFFNRKYYMSNDVWLVKLDANGNRKWQKFYGGSLGEYGSSLIQNPDGSFLIAATTLSSDGDIAGSRPEGNKSDVWILKLGAVSGVTEAGKISYHQRVFPNPATNTLNIASIEEPTPYKIIDILGRTVMQGMVLDRATLTLDVSSLPGGVYFIFVDDLRDHHPVSVGKVMIVGK